MELDFDLFIAEFTKYLTEYCVKKSLVEDTTIKRKEELFFRLANFLNGKPFSLENVEAFQDYLYVNGWDKPSSRAKLVDWIRAFVNWCYRYEDLFEKNWAYKIIKPKVPKKKWHLLSEENALKVIIAGCEINPFDNRKIRTAKNEHLLGLEFILLHGFRVDEVVKMQGSDVKLDADIPYVRIREPKSQEEEWQPIHSHFIPILRERINNNRLFRINKKTCNIILKRGAEKLGFTGYDVTCHRLRDIYALNRLRKQNRQLVSRTLRHDKFDTTDKHYSHYELSDLAPVVEDSNVLQSPITASEYLKKAKKALKLAGLERPDQYEMRIYETNNIVKIEAIFPNRD